MISALSLVWLSFWANTTTKIPPKDGIIRLDNPSFEGTPQDATSPVGWIPCGEHSTPDIQPGFWGCYTPPSDGDTYLGLTTREDGTWESITQRLSQPLKANECYDFNIDLARSNQYIGYNIPIKLRVWAGNKRCSKSELLTETPIIKHTTWQTYHLQFNPKKDYKFIIFEVHYASGIYFTYKGNLLLDNCSPIIPCARA
jgi:hypothetical protein